MQLQLQDKIIKEPIYNILLDIRRQTHNPQDIKINHSEVLCSCPFHKDGKERNPSCGINNKMDIEVPYGTFHCWSCGASGSLPKLVGKLFNRDYVFGEQWLVDNYGNTFVDEITLPDSIVPPKAPEKKYLDESVLEQYNYYHPYMWKRHLTKEVVDTFSVGYDKDSDSITFPVWDENNHLVMITKRRVKGKMFEIAKDVDKPVYLLNFLLASNCKTAYVCESQINALTLCGYGLPAIALFGTGSKHQYEILKRSGILKYILCFDGDLAGEHGKNRFIKALKNYASIYYINMPQGKDVNDLSKDEFFALPIQSEFDKLFDI